MRNGLRQRVALAILVGVLVLAMCSLACSAGAGPGPGADGSEASAHATARAATLRLRIDWVGAEGEPRWADCVGAQLEPGLLLTAAHCLAPPDTAWRLSCRSIDGVHADLQPVPAARVRRHPSHDLALVWAALPPACASGALAIAQNDRDAGPVLTFASDRADDRQDAEPVTHRTWSLVARDDHVLRLRPDGVCLDRGDSGHPMFMLRNGEPELVGILVTGAKDCRDTQTALRLAPLRTWIEQRRQ